MKNKYAEIYKPFIKDVITNIYNQHEYIEFYESDEFSLQEKHTLLVKMTFKVIKRDAMVTRMNRTLKNMDIKEIASNITSLIDTVIALEQGIYRVAYSGDNQDTDADDLLAEVSDLYGGVMDLETTQLFEEIRSCIDELNLFQELE